MYKILYIQHTQIFKKCTKLYRFNIHIFEWKYKIVYIQLIQIFEEYNQFCTFKHTHTQLNWDYLCESKQKSIRHWKSKVPFYIVKSIQQNPTTIYWYTLNFSGTTMKSKVW